MQWHVHVQVFPRPHRIRLVFSVRSLGTFWPVTSMAPSSASVMPSASYMSDMPSAVSLASIMPSGSSSDPSSDSFLNKAMLQAWPHALVQLLQMPVQLKLHLPCWQREPQGQYASAPPEKKSTRRASLIPRWPRSLRPTSGQRAAPRLHGGAPCGPAPRLAMLLGAARSAPAC